MNHKAVLMSTMLVVVGAGGGTLSLTGGQAPDPASEWQVIRAGWVEADRGSRDPDSLTAARRRFGARAASEASALSVRLRTDGTGWLDKYHPPRCSRGIGEPASHSRLRTCRA